MAAPFQISTNDKEFCYKPLVCATDRGYLVVWAHGVEQQSIAWLQRFENNQAVGKPTSLGALDEDDRLSFFKKHGDDEYVLLIEKLGSFTAIFFDGSGEVVRQRTVETEEVLVDCYSDNGRDVLFLYDYSRSVFSVGIANDINDWDDLKIANIYYDVWGIPIVFNMDKSNYAAAWITHSNNLSFVTNNLHYDLLRHTTIEKDYNVDYLVGTKIADDWIVLGGAVVDSRRRPTYIVRFDYCQVAGGVLKNIVKKQVVSEDYYKSTIGMVGNNAGLLLYTDSANEDQVSLQQFTKWATYLYPLIPVDATTKDETWNPSAATFNDTTLVVYVKTNGEFSTVWGMTVNNFKPPLSLDKIVTCSSTDYTMESK